MLLQKPATERNLYTVNYNSHSQNMFISEELKGGLSLVTRFHKQAAKINLLTVFIAPLFLHSTCNLTYRSYMNYYQCLTTFSRQCGKNHENAQLC